MSLGILGCVLGVGMCGLLELNTSAQNREGVRKIQFSATQSDEVATNINQLGNRKDGLHQLEDSLFKPLQSVAPKTSLEGLFVPPPRTVIAPSPAQTKKAKELRDRQKNWAFIDPDEAEKQQSSEEAMKVTEYGPDGKEKTKLTLVEQFYRRLERQGKQGDGQDDNQDEESGTSRKQRSTRDSSDADDDSKSNSSSGKNGDGTKKKDSDSWQLSPIMTPLAAPGPFGDSFNSDDSRSTPSQEQSDMQKSRVSDFQRILGISPQPAAGGISSLSPAVDPGYRPIAPLGGLDGLGGLGRSSSFEPSLGTISPAASFGGLADPGSRSLNLQPLPSAGTRIDTPNFTPPTLQPPPSFAAPVRKF